MPFRRTSKPIWKGQCLKNTEEKIRGNNTKLEPNGGDIHTTWQLPQQDFKPGGIYSETTAGPQITSSHLKSPKEPQQFHLHNLVVIFKSRIPKFCELQTLQHPDLNLCYCRICHCIATCHLNAPFLSCSAARVHRGEVNVLLQELSPSCPPSSSSKLSHIFPAAGSEMATLLSAPKTFIVLQGLTQSHRKPRSTLSQHLLIWLNATKTETKAYFIKFPTLITTAPAFPRQLSSTCDNPAFVYGVWRWKGKERTRKHLCKTPLLTLTSLTWVRKPWGNAKVRRE